MGKWKSFKDSLPEIGATCLVTDGDVVTIMEFVPDGETPLCLKFHDRDMGFEVYWTHWMQVPDKPIPTEEEKGFSICFSSTHLGAFKIK